jgi:uncharacterized damage-inducible protein DinB
VLREPGAAVNVTTNDDFQCRELASFWDFIAFSLDHLLGCLDGLSAEQLNWRPTPSGTNSVYALAVHTLGNAEENLLTTLCGAPANNREGEFSAEADSTDWLMRRWTALRAELRAALAALDPAELERERLHPRRGQLTGREVLLVVVRHAAEHLGQAELTLDVMRASMGGSGTAP